ncbi:rhodanese-like domain-containing protein [Haloplasma contractile]|uniref:Rhodanese-like domain protein n=1 Tax=Haloplasma contractile SSD-17B TaxID=1033810 RepID=U2E024_9MOLU|nr:rhodanese-like domain-containing protein [Haloplasma contractile]ERJ13782.1 Rhodanese-like domain protein [Haloplasma contractile SSD-17B]
MQLETWHIIVLVVMTTLVFFFTLTYFQQKNACESLSADELKKCMRKGQLIDVRTKKEYEAGHINGARNISVQTIGREYKKIRKDQPIYLYCASGKRSKRAALLLKAKGYTDIYDLAGGIVSWNGPLK